MKSEAPYHWASVSAWQSVIRHPPWPEAPLTTGLRTGSTSLLTLFSLTIGSVGATDPLLCELFSRKRTESCAAFQLLRAGSGILITFN